MSAGRGIRLSLVLIVLAWWFTRRRMDVVEVRGASMAPALLPGDRLLVMRMPVRIGDVVLAHDPRDRRRELIKRVTSIDPAGVTLHGDNLSASTDARSFGAVPSAAVEWRAVLRYWPRRRVGRVPRMVFDEGGEAACTFPSALIAGS